MYVFGEICRVLLKKNVFQTDLHVRWEFKLILYTRFGLVNLDTSIEISNKEENSLFRAKNWRSSEQKFNKT